MSKGITRDIELPLSNTPEELAEMTTAELRILWKAAREEITERRRHGNTPQLRRAMRDMGACRAELNRRDPRSQALPRFTDMRTPDHVMATPYAAGRTHADKRHARNWAGRSD